jgi:SAM-dependent methyltransferase
MNWSDFWNGPTAIYVSERHKLLHGLRLARDLAELIPSPDAHVLDFGCGEASAATESAGRCAKLYLCDVAPTIRERLRLRLGRNPRIVVLAPEAVAADIPDASLDLVLVNSVVQYLSQSELAESLALWRAKLRPSGLLVIADVIPRGLSPLSDAAALLRFGFQGGFFFAAVLGLGRTALSDYRRLRRDLGLSTYAPSEIETLLSTAGFKAERRIPNLGHNPSRMTFFARLQAQGGIAAQQ